MCFEKVAIHVCFLWQVMQTNWKMLRKRKNYYNKRYHIRNYLKMLTINFNLINANRFKSTPFVLVLTFVKLNKRWVTFRKTIEESRTRTFVIYCCSKSIYLYLFSCTALLINRIFFQRVLFICNILMHSYP